MTWEVRQGDVLEVLRTLPDEHVQTVVTSPPYMEPEGGGSYLVVKL